MLCVLFPELFHSSFGIDELLLAGKEGMAVGTYVHMYGVLRRERCESLSTGTYGLYFL